MNLFAKIMALAVAVLALVATPLVAQDKGTTGIKMPAKSSARWLSGGGEPEINDMTTCDNGIKDYFLWYYLLEPVLVDVSSWEEAPIGSGYYAIDQVS